MKKKVLAVTVLIILSLVTVAGAKSLYVTKPVPKGKDIPFQKLSS